MVTDELILKAHMPTINEMLKIAWTIKILMACHQLEMHLMNAENLLSKENFKWSHPMIYHVGREVGWSKINLRIQIHLTNLKINSIVLRKNCLKVKILKFLK